MRKEEADSVLTSAEVLPCCICHVLALSDISLCGSAQQLNTEKVGRLSTELFRQSSVCFNRMKDLRNSPCFPLESRYSRVEVAQDSLWTK